MRQPTFRVAIVSDVHYAGAAERQRGDYTLAGMERPLARALLRAYRRFIWLRDPCAHNHLLDQFLEQSPAPDFVVSLILACGT